MNSPQKDPLWPDAYDHCCKCDEIKIKTDMIKLREDQRFCVACAAQQIKILQQFESDAKTLEQENDELRTALEAFAQEICQRRMFGFANNAAFEQVSNNQICRTYLTHAGYKAATPAHE